MSIVGALFDYSLLVECDAEVILDCRVSLVGKFDLATAESVHLLILQRVTQTLCGLIESRHLD